MSRDRNMKRVSSGLYRYTVGGRTFQIERPERRHGPWVVREVEVRKEVIANATNLINAKYYIKGYVREEEEFFEELTVLEKQANARWREARIDWLEAELHKLLQEEEP